MPPRSLVRASRAVVRGIRNSNATRIASQPLSTRARPVQVIPTPTIPIKLRHYSGPSATSDGSKPGGKKTCTIANITDKEYHSAADEYLDFICNKFEELQDERADVDVEYSQGVLTIAFPPSIGTYVLNKQPFNKQIWLSSPISGPRRFDYVIMGDGQGDKHETSAFGWLCMRDMSSLTELFLAETGVDLSMPIAQYGE